MLRSVSLRPRRHHRWLAPPRHTEVDVKDSAPQVRSIIHGLDSYRSSESLLGMSGMWSMGYDNSIEQAGA